MFQVRNCGILILAAGQSARMGSPKQLLEVNGKSFIRKIVDTALSAEIGKVMVVLGANADLIRPELNIPGLLIVENMEWEEGMSSSIRTGLDRFVNTDMEIDGLMILVCDQPFLEKTLLKQLISVQAESGLPIVASTYEGRSGTPALFHSSYFPMLQKLTGDKGARSLIAEFSDQVALVPFDLGYVDIDTKEDYNKLIDNK